MVASGRVGIRALTFGWPAGDALQIVLEMHTEGMVVVAFGNSLVLMVLQAL
jgi:hypothetical protein